MTRTGWIWAIVAILVVAGGAYWLLGMGPAASTTNNDNVTGTTTGTNETPDGSNANPGVATGVATGATATGGTATGATATGSVTGTVSAGTPMTASVAYNGTAFSPKDVTIKKGGTVTWTNSGSGQMWVASASHPTHAVYAGTTRTEHCPGGSNTAFDQCAGGQSYSFKFDKVGKWNYHDHINASAFGSVTVVE